MNDGMKQSNVRVVLNKFKQLVCRATECSPKQPSRRCPHPARSFNEPENSCRCLDYFEIIEQKQSGVCLQESLKLGLQICVFLPAVFGQRFLDIWTSQLLLLLNSWHCLHSALRTIATR